MTPIVRMALEEDIGTGDVTTRACVPEAQQARGRFLAREPLIVAGLDLLRELYDSVTLRKNDGDSCIDGEVIAEVAGRIGITELEVRNVATYYSMLRFKPVGKYNVQVCTNISCMLRGGYDVFERFQQELGIGHKGVTPDGIFSLEEVECIGVCCWAPAIQVNYEFHDELSPDHVPGILDSYRGRMRTKGNVPHA